MLKETFVIVGAGLAGAKAAEELRNQGFAGNIVLVGSEDRIPYERPPLSKAFLRGEAGRKSTFVFDESFYSEKDIELRTSTRAISLDTDARRVELAGGESLHYDRLLLATGARSRRSRVPGADLDGVVYLRTMAESDALRARLEEGGRLAIVGGGWIGAEVAASARQIGVEVTMLVRGSLPLERVLGPELAYSYAEMHRRHGVEILSRVDVAAFEGSGSVERVRLSSGEVVECETVLVAIGAEPNTELAGQAGIELDNGIAVDEHMETSAPGVFAAGDVASAWHPLYRRRLRVEHWDNAIGQGVAAARNMAGRATPYDAIPYFFSDQYDTGLEYRGWTKDWDSVVIRGRRDEAYVAFWLKDGRVAAAANFNVWDHTDALKALVGSNASVPEAELGNPDMALEDLARPLAAKGA